MPDIETTPPADGPGDEHLLARLQLGDMAALELLYDRYAGQAFALATRIVANAQAAEEVTQDAFMSAWRQARTYDASLGRVRPWLLSIVRNRAIDHLRRQRKHRAATVLDEAWMTQAPDDAFADAVRNLGRRELRELLQQLPPAQRHAIGLIYLQGYTSAEIAQAMRVPVGTVKSRVRLGLARLRQSLSQQAGLTYAG